MTPQTAQKLTLFELERELVELIEFAEEATAEEEIVAARTLIGQYLEKRADKVDHIRGYLKHCDMMALCARDEAQTQTQRAKAWEARGQRLKDACVSVMTQFGEKRLEGRTGQLKVQPNPPSVEVYDIDLVPFEFQHVYLKMPAELWAGIVTFVGTFRAVVQALAPDLLDRWAEYRKLLDGRAEPDKIAIKAALNQPCEACEHLTDKDRPECRDCGGTGKQRVPGTRLVSDKTHLRIV
jgi:hypothetical protein